MCAGISLALLTSLRFVGAAFSALGGAETVESGVVTESDGWSAGDQPPAGTLDSEVCAPGGAGLDDSGVIGKPTSLL